MTRYNLQNLYYAKIKEKYLLSKKGSTKEVYHIIFDIKDSGIIFSPGDCLGVIPENDPNIVKKCLEIMKIKNPKDIIVNRFSKTFNLEDFLSKHANISKVQSKILKIFFPQTRDKEKLKKLEYLLKDTNKDQLKEYLQNNDLLDILEEFFEENVNAEDICSCLLPLMPRLYSISSAQSPNKDILELTVTNVKYEINGKKKMGVCSHFLCDFAKDNIRTYIHPSHRFFLPQDSNKDIIMIAAGSGIAPFRSFIQERSFKKARGKNWLFFGECNRKYDYYYEEYFEKLKNEGILKISLAFSRDQEEKVYVQHKLYQHKDEFFKWFENGANIYICGSARTLAKAIDKCLIEIFKEKLNLSEENAGKYLSKLIAEKRYLKDVY